MEVGSEPRRRAGNTLPETACARDAADDGATTPTVKPPTSPSRLIAHIAMVAAVPFVAYVWRGSAGRIMYRDRVVGGDRLVFFKASDAHVAIGTVGNITYEGHEGNEVNFVDNRTKVNHMLRLTRGDDLRKTEGFREWQLRHVPELGAVIVGFPLWPVLLLTAVFGALSLRRLVVVARDWRHLAYRKRMGHCLCCGYDLSYAVSPRCPECGESIGATVQRR